MVACGLCHTPHFHTKLQAEVKLGYLVPVVPDIWLRHPYSDWTTNLFEPKTFREGEFTRMWERMQARDA